MDFPRSTDKLSRQSVTKVLCLSYERGLGGYGDSCKVA